MHILYIYPEFTIKGGADKVIIEKANYLADSPVQEAAEAGAASATREVASALNKGLATFSSQQLGHNSDNVS